jgi:hypothetical protein
MCVCVCVRELQTHAKGPFGITHISYKRALGIPKNLPKGQEEIILGRS